jgi:hypothetical protein
LRRCESGAGKEDEEWRKRVRLEAVKKWASKRYTNYGQRPPTFLCP